MEITLPRQVVVSALIALVSLTQGFKLSLPKARNIDEVDDNNPFAGGHKLYWEKKLPESGVQVTEGSTLDLKCKTGGSPSPTIHWLRNGVRIPQGRGRVSDDEAAYENTARNAHQPQLHLAAARGRLVVDCATHRADGGIYTCVAETPTQRISSSTMVEVGPALDNGYDASCLATKGIEIERSPYIYLWLAQRLEFEGGDVQLYCRAEGAPTPSITWYDPRGHPISQGQSGYRLLSNGDILIKNLNWMHMGAFRCEATNEHGSDNESTFIYPTRP